MLAIKDITFHYGKTKVLDKVTLEVNKGDFLGLIGPNGSGKSTLIKLIVGLLQIQEGSITKKTKNIGYVPQKAKLETDFPATVEEVAGMGIRKSFPHFLSKKDKQDIRKYLGIVGMEEHIGHRIGELSGGQQQRVFIARALVSKPELLILDEPTAGVDHLTQEKFYGLLGKLNKRGIAIMLVTHDIGTITRYVNKVACLNQTLVFHGSHKEFCDHEVAHTLGEKKHLLVHTHD
ncbi:MAG: ABC transporter ATP-binding protein [Nanoarchaeota archaeon]